MTKNPWIRFVIVTAITVVTVFTLNSCTGTERDSVKTLEQISVRFPIPIIEAGQTPFYVAQDKGYYADENLDVKFEMGSRELNPVKTVATGQDTFGILGGPDTLLTAISKGQPLKAIAILHRNSNFPALVTLNSSGITKLEQHLLGKNQKQKLKEPQGFYTEVEDLVIMFKGVAMTLEEKKEVKKEEFNWKAWEKTMIKSNTIFKYRRKP